ncbi:MAG: TonB family protein [Bacteriovoracia bacterium]
MGYLDQRIRTIYLPTSLGFHALLLALAIVLSMHRPSEDTIVNKPIFIEVEKSDTNVRHQIVDSKKGEKTKEAAPTAFLGQETRTVTEETVAKLREAKAQPMPQSRPQPKASPAPVVDMARLGVPIAVQKTKNQDTPQWAEAGDQAGAGAHDYVKGVKESDISALNTKEFVFYGYFQRIRGQLDQAWKPLLREKLYNLFRVGRGPAGDMDHITRTKVTLDHKGEVVRVQVVSESGTRDLDDTAVRAFNSAGPFPNPPKGLVDREGRIEIQWDFILKT